MGQQFYKYLDENGDGTGSKNCNGNGAGVGGPLYYRHTAVRPYLLHQMRVYINDDGPFLADTLGASTAPTRPVALGVFNGSLAQAQSFLTIGNLSRNRDFERSSFDVKYYAFGSGNNFMYAVRRWLNSHGPIYVPTGYSVCIATAADLSMVDAIYVKIRGEYE